MRALEPSVESSKSLSSRLIGINGHRPEAKAQFTRRLCVGYRSSAELCKRISTKVVTEAAK